MQANRLFALKLIPLFAVTGYLLYRHYPEVGLGWMGCGILLIGAGLFRPAWLTPLHRLFDLIGRALRAALSRLCLELVYALIVVPMALIARRMGKTFLKLETDEQASSYFIRRDGSPKTEADYAKGY